MTYLCNSKDVNASRDIRSLLCVAVQVYNAVPVSDYTLAIISYLVPSRDINIHPAVASSLRLEFLDVRRGCVVVVVVVVVGAPP